MAWRLAALLVSLAAAVPSAASPSDPALLAELVARARAAHLAEDRGWLLLGHWRPRLLGGWESEVDGREFFLARDGKHDPAAELEATLAGFLEATPRPEELDNARCRFPARLAFLAGRLGLDEASLPAHECPRRDQFLSEVSPRQVTYVFSSYYLNNPASAFGHTLIRFDRTGTARAGREGEILDYGVDFAATVDTSNAILYAAKGLLGLFHGQFSYFAYYYKVRQYGDYESRDLFEYALALEPSEAALLARHVWELGGTWFQYWYLDENCSYQVLAAIEAAAPRLDLVSHVGKWVVLPSDTVQALFANPGLVRRVYERPSIRTQFQARASGLLRGEAAIVEALESDPKAPFPDGLPETRRAAVLDAAADLLDLRHAHGLLLGTDHDAIERRQVLLARRAELRVVSPPLVLPEAADRRPETGHRSMRLGGGGGATREGGGFASLDLRLALHDLLDPPDGYPRDAQIEFLPARIRYYTGSRRLELDDASLVRVYAINPLGRFDLRPSWRMWAGATTVRDGGCHDCLAASLDLGGGPSVTDVLGFADLLLFGDSEVLASGTLHGMGGSPVRVGLGPSGLLRIRVGTMATFLAEARWRWLPLADPETSWSLSGALRLHAARNLSLGVEGRRSPTDGEISGTVFGYF